MSHPNGGQTPAHGSTKGKRPRAWHVAAAVTLALFVMWLIASALGAACEPAARPTYTSPLTAAPTTTTAPTTTFNAMPPGCRGERALDAESRAWCAQESRERVERQREWDRVMTTAPKPTTVRSAAPVATGDTTPSATCTDTSGARGVLMLGQFLGIIATGVLGWKRRKDYTNFRKSVFAVDDYARRVPPGTESYVDLATHQMAAAAAATASADMWMNQGFWFAPSGTAVQQRIDQIRETGARAQAAAQQIQMAQYAPVDDEPAEDLAAPDLGRGDTAATPDAASDDWMSGVSDNDNDW